MTKMTYREQLLHPNWQRRRLEILSGANFTCESCGDAETTLHVHHRRYVKGRMAWEYEDHELEALCEPCHQRGHADREFLDRLLAEGQGRVADAIGTLVGRLSMSMDSDIAEEREALRIAGEAFLAGAIGSMLAFMPASAVAAAIREVRAGTFLNPAEEALLREMERPSDSAADQG